MENFEKRKEEYLKKLASNPSNLVYIADITDKNSEASLKELATMLSPKNEKELKEVDETLDFVIYSRKFNEILENKKIKNTPFEQIEGFQTFIKVVETKMNKPEILDNLLKSLSPAEMSKITFGTNFAFSIDSDDIDMVEYIFNKIMENCKLDKTTRLFYKMKVEDELPDCIMETIDVLKDYTVNKTSEEYSHQHAIEYTKLCKEFIAKNNFEFYEIDDIKKYFRQ